MAVIYALVSLLLAFDVNANPLDMQEVWLDLTKVTNQIYQQNMQLKNNLVFNSN